MRTGGSLLSETRYTGRIVAEWQASDRYRVTVGVEGKRTSLSFWASEFLRPASMDAYVVDPVQLGVFAFDRTELGDVVIEGGLRFDYYDSDALFAKTPGFVFSHSAWNFQAATDDTAYANSLARVFARPQAHSSVSPRLRATLRLGKRTDVQVAYARQVQPPDFATLLSGVNNDLSFANTSEPFGRDIGFGRKTVIEAGVRHAFAPALVLGVTAYDQRGPDYVVRILPFANPRSPSDTLSINALTTRDVADSRGVDVTLDWGVANYVRTSLTYTFHHTRPSDPFTSLTMVGDRRHNLVGAVTLSLPDGWRPGTTLGALARATDISTTFRAVSGSPYTRLVNEGTGSTVPPLGFGLGGRAAEALNSSRLPWTKHLDLKIRKRFRRNRWDVVAYADVRNVFNWTNVLGLYAETGDVVNLQHRELTVSPEFSALADEAGIAGALNPDGSINLTAVPCSSWSTPVNCESLRRVEARFGDGDGVYTVAEQTRALYTAYDELFGPHRFRGPGRHVRLGIEVTF